MTYAFPDLTITTWGKDHWRARWNDGTVREFDAPRDTPPEVLHRMAAEMPEVDRESFLRKFVDERTGEK